MDRTAFEATFYAKQKELKFFAQDDGIGRVRKISKMLGISRVEAAQKFLRNDRNELHTEARVIEGRLAEADLESLKHQLEEFQWELRRLEEELEISGEYEAAEEELKSARKARSTSDAAYRETRASVANACGRLKPERQRAGTGAEAERGLEDLRLPRRS